MQTQNQVGTNIAKTRAEFPFKVSTKRLTQNYCFQEFGWLLFPGSSSDYWTHAFTVKTFRENFNVTSYYAEDTMVLYIYSFIHLAEDCCSVSMKR